MGFNLPPDWDEHQRTCTVCAGAYHASGTVECRCTPCSRSGALVYSANQEHQDGQCDDCYCHADENENRV